MARNRKANLVGTITATSLNVESIILVSGQDVSGQANNAYAQANAAYSQANSAYTQGNSAYSQANNAYSQANSAYGQANSSYSQANSAYTQANTATTNAANAHSQANNAYSQANSAYGAANTAQTTAQNAYTQANNSYGQANSAYNQANTATTNAGNAYSQANTATTIAGNAYGQANTAYNAANTAQTAAQDAYAQANSAYSQSNNAYTQANSAYAQANLAYTQANTAFTAANNSNLKLGGVITGTLNVTNDIIVGGNVYLQGNTTYINVSTYQINDSLMYIAANNILTDSVDIGFVGAKNTSGAFSHTGFARDATDGKYKLFDNLPDSGHVGNVIDFANTSLATLVANIEASSILLSGNAVATNVSVSAAYGQANLAYSQANSSYSQANSAYSAANNRVLKAGDTMTGQLNISSGGLLVTGNSNFDSGTLFVDSVNDKVGINTSTPGYRLTVAGSSGTAALSLVESGVRTWTIDAGGQSTNTFRIADITADSARLLIDSSGNVAIGTTSTSSKLHIVSGSAESTGFTLETTGSSGKTFFAVHKLGYVRLRSSDTNGAAVHLFDNAGSKRAEMGVGSDSKINWYSDALAATWLVFDGANNRVGIGTDDPRTPLYVRGDGAANNARGVIRIDNTGSDKWSFISLPDSASGGDTSANNYYLIGRTASFTNRTLSLHIPTASDYGSGSQPQIGFYSTGADLLFSVQATTGNAYIKGNVGIGTTNPAVKLDVDGAGRFRGGSLYLGFPDTSSGHINSYELMTFNIDSDNDDSNTRYFAWYKNAADGSGTELMRLTESGNVGIANTAPDVRLQIGNLSSTSTATPETLSLGGTFSSTAGANPKIRVWTDGANTMGFGVSSDQLDYIGTGSYSHVFYTNGSEKMRITGGGNVGIGTSPGNLLHLYSASNPFIRIQTGGGQYSYLRLDDGSSNGYLIKNVSAETTNGALAGALYTYTDNNKAFQHIHGGTALFTILSTGNVGVGTASPQGKQHNYISSRSTAFSASDGTTWHDLIIQNPNNTLSAAVGIAFELNSAYHSNAGTGIAAVKSTASSDYGADMVFVTRPQNAVAEERLRITSGGNVGIGTTNPRNKLHVFSGSSGAISSESKYDGMDDDLILYIPFAEGTGTAAYDRSQYGLNGTLTNGPTWGTGIFGYGAVLDNSNDYISVAAPVSNISLGTTMTYSMWIYPTSTTAKRNYLFDLRGDGSSSGTDSYFLYDRSNSTTVTFTVGDSGLEVISSSVTMGTNTWFHAAATRSGNTWRIYLNGIEIKNGTTGTTAITLSNSFRIGTYSSGTSGEYFFGGTLDEAKLWKRTLTANEIRRLYLEGSATNSPYVTTGGNVGIGTTTAGSKLTVSGSNDGATPLLDLKASGTGTFQRGVRLLNSGMNSGDHIMYACGYADSSKNMGQFYFRYASSGSDDNRISIGLHSVDDVFNILGSGNVGIGTTSPGQKLHVQGKVLINAGTGASTFDDLNIGGIGGWSNTEAHRINFVYNTASSPTIFTTIESKYNSSTNLAELRFKNMYNAGVGTATIMSLFGSGFVGINIEAAYETGDIFRVQGVSAFVNNGAKAMSVGRNTNTGTLIEFFYAGAGGKGTITTDGTNVAYNTSSDRRLKLNIQPADSASSVIDGIQIVKHDWNTGKHTRYGVVAQDLYNVAPEAVSVGDSEEIENPRNPWGVDYSKLVPILIKEIQELRARVAVLEAK